MTGPSPGCNPPSPPRRDDASRAARPLLIAHRGESRDAPENTLAAIHLAWRRGARAVEVDARLAADGELVVIHDPDLRRTAGLRQAVAALPATDLRTFDVGAWKHPRWRGERIPLLREVFATIPHRGRLFLELKAGPECAPALARELKAAPHLQAGQVLLMSFAPECVAAAAAAAPDHEICLLLRAQDYLGADALAHAIRRARDLGCRSLDVEAHRRLDARVVATVHAAGLRLYTWTVNRLPPAQRLVAAGLDGITTDRCAWLARQLGWATD